MNVNIKNLNLSVIMPAITKSGQPVCNDRVPSKEDKVEHASGLYLIYEDGHAEPFTRENSKENVKYIGLKHKTYRLLLHWRSMIVYSCLMMIASKNLGMKHITNVNVMRCLILTDRKIRNAL